MLVSIKYRAIFPDADMFRSSGVSVGRWMATGNSGARWASEFYMLHGSIPSDGTVHSILYLTDGSNFALTIMKRIWVTDSSNLHGQIEWRE